jgi:hypothetical protein
MSGGDSPAEIARNLGAAAGLGVAIAAVYYLTQRRSRTEVASFVSTLVLLTVLLAMVTVVIGNNLARAFGLVGALSIVRFRTVVDDTRDTAFVIFAVVTGMAVGSGLLLGALAAFPVVSATAILLAAWGGRGSAPPATLVVKVGSAVADPQAVIAEPMAKYLKDVALAAVGTARQGAAVEFTFTARLRPGVTAVAIITDLHRIEGVQGVEWKGPTSG